MVQQVFEVCTNLVEIFITTGFLTVYLGCRFKGIKALTGFFFWWMCGFLEICIMNYITYFESFGSYLPIIIYFLYALFCLKGNKLLKLWMSIITQIIVTMVAVVTNILVCCIIDYDPNKVITVFNDVRIFCVVISKIILCICYYIIVRNKYKHPIENKLWYALIVIPLVSVSSITTLMKVALKYVDMKEYILFGMISIVISNIMTYYFYTVISREYKNKLKLNILKQHHENAKKIIESSEAFISQMRTVKHDISNQLLTIYGHIEKGRVNDAKNYIQNITNNYIPKVTSCFNSSNAAFDAIINTKLAICANKNIHMTVIMAKDFEIGLPDIDCVTLFGNLIDNAIEAAEQSEQKMITVIVQNKGNYLFIHISNTIERSVLYDNSELKTSKSDKINHGIGIKSIKSITEKYNGIFDTEEINGEFNCYVTLDRDEMYETSRN